MKLRYVSIMTHADADLFARQPALVAESVGKRFGDTEVLKGIDLNVAPGEIVALLGSSGCGKTTLLRIAAGLLSASNGRMQIAGHTVVDGAVHTLPPEARGIGMVFQDYALWPHLSVLDNVAFPLRMRGERKAARQDRARKALARVGLDHLADRSPGTLSGGQQQRVALARAIVAEPPLVLFDEPLSNLDRELRESLALEMSTLLRELGLSAIYVTHDQAEAFTVADRVAIMIGGGIAQIAAPETIFSDPASVDVAQFLNIGALIDGDIAEKRFRGSSELLSVETPLSNGYEGRAKLLIPRTAVRADSAGPLKERVRRSQFQGDRYLLHLELGEGGHHLVCPADAPAAQGAEIALALQGERLRVFTATH